MATKTEEYLRILAEGGDAPTDCCMTQTQSLIAQAIDRINNLGDGGTVVLLNDYINGQTMTITDLDGIRQAIEDGKALYWNNPAGDGTLPDMFFDAAIDQNTITLTSTPQFMDLGGVMLLASMVLTFDAQTGAPTSNTVLEGMPLTLMGQAGGQIGYLPKLEKLQINIGSDTYEYDGTQAVNITIADGENMGF